MEDWASDVCLALWQRVTEVLSEEGRGLVVGGLLIGERLQLRGTLAHLVWGDVVQPPVF